MAEDMEKYSCVVWVVTGMSGAFSTVSTRDGATVSVVNMHVSELNALLKEVGRTHTRSQSPNSNMRSAILVALLFMIGKQGSGPKVATGSGINSTKLFFCQPKL